MKSMRIAGLIVVAALSLSSAWALEIPLGGISPAGGTGGGTAVGFVDMDRIFQIFPQTEGAKEDYAKQLQKRRDQLAEKDAQVNNLKSRIAVLESTLKDMQSATPPDTTAAGDTQAPPVEDRAEKGKNSSQSLGDMKAQLETQVAEYDDLRKQAEQDLATFQSRQSELILGKIYQALRDLAQEEQLTIVIDKSSILYGDTAIDLTDKLQAKVRGY